MQSLRWCAGATIAFGVLLLSAAASAQDAMPDKAKLESVPNPHADTDYVARFTAPEFTTLCPVTGQPDFAHFVIDYCPKGTILESKSLKLFLSSFRNHASFHEDTTILIGKRIAAATSASTCSRATSSRGPS